MQQRDCMYGLMSGVIHVVILSHTVASARSFSLQLACVIRSGLSQSADEPLIGRLPLWLKSLTHQWHEPIFVPHPTHPLGIYLREMGKILVPGGGQAELNKKVPFLLV